MPDVLCCGCRENMVPIDDKTDAKVAFCTSCSLKGIPEEQSVSEKGKPEKNYPRGEKSKFVDSLLEQGKTPLEVSKLAIVQFPLDNPKKIAQLCYTRLKIVNRKRTQKTT